VADLPPLFHMIEERKLLNIWSETDELRNLPDFPGPMDVSIPIESLKRFRNDYAMLNEFAANVCGVPREKVCLADMIGWLMRREMDRREVLDG